MGRQSRSHRQTDAVASLSRATVVKRKAIRDAPVVREALTTDVVGRSRALESLERLLTGLGYGSRIVDIEAEDPEAIAETLGTLAIVAPMPAVGIGLTGTRRETVRSAMLELRSRAPTPLDNIPLAAGAPYGEVQIDSRRCTLCLACVGTCPTRALLDTPDRPALRFVEAACVQCGLCVATCPEKALSLSPRLLLSREADLPRELKAEDAFLCRACGTPFGTRASIARVQQLLEGNTHFADESRLALLTLCGDCRVTAAMREGHAPLSGAPRPRVRTSDDYIADAAADASDGSPRV